VLRIEHRASNMLGRASAVLYSILYFHYKEEISGLAEWLQ
jgi:hypothetical protein